MGVPDHLTTSLPQRLKPLPVEDVAASMKPCNDKEFEFWMTAYAEFTPWYFLQFTRQKIEPATTMRPQPLRRLTQDDSRRVPRWGSVGR